MPHNYNDPFRNAIFGGQANSTAEDYAARQAQRNNPNVSAMGNTITGTGEVRNNPYATPSYTEGTPDWYYNKFGTYPAGENGQPGGDTSWATQSGAVDVNNPGQLSWIGGNPYFGFNNPADVANLQRNYNRDAGPGDLLWSPNGRRGGAMTQTPDNARSRDPYTIGGPNGQGKGGVSPELRGELQTLAGKYGYDMPGGLGNNQPPVAPSVAGEMGYGHQDPLTGEWVPSSGQTPPVEQPSPTGGPVNGGYDLSGMGINLDPNANYGSVGGVDQYGNESQGIPQGKGGGGKGGGMQTPAAPPQRYSGRYGYGG